MNEFHLLCSNDHAVISVKLQKFKGNHFLLESVKKIEIEKCQRDSKMKYSSSVEVEKDISSSMRFNGGIMTWLSVGNHKLFCQNASIHVSIISHDQGNGGILRAFAELQGKIVFDNQIEFQSWQEFSSIAKYQKDYQEYFIDRRTSFAYCKGFTRFDDYLGKGYCNQQGEVANSLQQLAIQRIVKSTFHSRRGYGNLDPLEGKRFLCEFIDHLKLSSRKIASFLRWKSLTDKTKRKEGHSYDIYSSVQFDKAVYYLWIFSHCYSYLSAYVKDSNLWVYYTMANDQQNVKSLSSMMDQLDAPLSDLIESSEQSSASLMSLLSKVAEESARDKHFMHFYNMALHIELRVKSFKNLDDFKKTFEFDVKCAGLSVLNQRSKDLYDVLKWRDGTSIEWQWLCFTCKKAFYAPLLSSKNQKRLPVFKSQIPYTPEVLISHLNDYVIIRDFILSKSKLNEWTLFDLKQKKVVYEFIFKNKKSAIIRHFDGSRQSVIFETEDDTGQATASFVLVKINFDGQRRPDVRITDICSLPCKSQRAVTIYKNWIGVVLCRCDTKDLGFKLFKLNWNLSEILSSEDINIDELNGQNKSNSLIPDQTRELDLYKCRLSFNQSHLLLHLKVPSYLVQLSVLVAVNYKKPNSEILKYLGTKNYSTTVMGTYNSAIFCLLFEGILNYQLVVLRKGALINLATTDERYQNAVLRKLGEVSNDSLCFEFIESCNKLAIWYVKKLKSNQPFLKLGVFRLHF